MKDKERKMNREENEIKRDKRQKIYWKKRKRWAKKRAKKRASTVINQARWRLSVKRERELLICVFFSSLTFSQMSPIIPCKWTERLLALFRWISSTSVLSLNPRKASYLLTLIPDVLASNLISLFFRVFIRCYTSLLPWLEAIFSISVVSFMKSLTAIFRCAVTLVIVAKSSNYE